MVADGIAFQKPNERIYVWALSHTANGPRGDGRGGEGGGHMIHDQNDYDHTRCHDHGPNLAMPRPQLGHTTCRKLPRSPVQNALRRWAVHFRVPFMNRT